MRSYQPHGCIWTHTHQIHGQKQFQETMHPPDDDVYLFNAIVLP